jgi:hypothetical protein
VKGNPTLAWLCREHDKIKAAGNRDKRRLSELQGRFSCELRRVNETIRKLDKDNGDDWKTL